MGHNTSNNTINVSHWVIVAIMAALLLITIWLMTTGSTGADDDLILNSIKSPLFAGFFLALLTFLIVDRWKRIETEITDIRKTQLSALKEVRSDADNLLKSKLDITTRKAEAIESKISGLLEEHPWVTSITENELIPDASSCRLVLLVAENFLDQGNLPLVYEYLASWTNEGARKTRLQGTSSDFLDLAEFCERCLGDDYLGLAIVGQGYQTASNNALLTPDYLVRLVRHGGGTSAREIATQLRSLMRLGFLSRLKSAFRGETRSNRATFYIRGFCALGLYESANGTAELAERFIGKAAELSIQLRAEVEVQIFRAETLAILGMLEKCERIMGSLDVNADSSDEIVYLSARIYRFLGRAAEAHQMMERFSPKGKLVDVKFSAGKRESSRPKKARRKPSRKKAPQPRGVASNREVGEPLQDRDPGPGTDPQIRPEL